MPVPGPRKRDIPPIKGELESTVPRPRRAARAMPVTSAYTEGGRQLSTLDTYGKSPRVLRPAEAATTIPTMTVVAGLAEKLTKESATIQANLGVEKTGIAFLVAGLGGRAAAGAGSNLLRNALIKRVAGGAALGGGAAALTDQNVLSGALLGGLTGGATFKAPRGILKKIVRERRVAGGAAARRAAAANAGRPVAPPATAAAAPPAGRAAPTAPRSPAAAPRGPTPPSSVPAPRERVRLQRRVDALQRRRDQAAGSRRQRNRPDPPPAARGVASDAAELRLTRDPSFTRTPEVVPPRATSDISARVRARQGTGPAARRRVAGEGALDPLRRQVEPRVDRAVDVLGRATIRGGEALEGGIQAVAGGAKAVAGGAKSVAQGAAALPGKIKAIPGGISERGIPGILDPKRIRDLRTAGRARMQQTRQRLDRSLRGESPAPPRRPGRPGITQVPGGAGEAVSRRVAATEAANAEALSRVTSPPASASSLGGRAPTTTSRVAPGRRMEGGVIPEPKSPSLPGAAPIIAPRPSGPGIRQVGPGEMAQSLRGGGFQSVTQGPRVVTSTTPTGLATPPPAPPRVRTGRRPSAPAPAAPATTPATFGGMTNPVSGARITSGAKNPARGVVDVSRVGMPKPPAPKRSKPAGLGFFEAASNSAGRFLEGGLG